MTWEGRRLGRRCARAGVAPGRWRGLGDELRVCKDRALTTATVGVLQARRRLIQGV
jgi:hypothetical protein